MVDKRHKDAQWTIPNPAPWEGATVAVLMDIRDELKISNARLERMLSILNCPNFLAIPHKLDRISHNTAKPRKTKDRGGKLL